ncbi:MAG: helix-turn-helix domain-containing protein, partial [Butyricicoccus sp.]|nr:helix-turn-helix domain-containing protein [Butyricicoccus sp.]
MKDTKERILETALGLFAREGYRAVSVSRIAGALGMTKSALYKHFGSKRDIFDEIVA